MKCLLAPISLLLKCASFIRWKLYRYRIIKSRKAPAPVISVGNISLGGTGKTPCVIWLAENLIARGFEPIILTRGYKRERKERMFVHGNVPEAILAGDEPAMMARSLSKTTIVVHKDRHRSAVEMGYARNRIFILDDGFQHLKLARDFDIVLLDGENPFGDGHFAPWGRLRDGLWRLSEADAIIIVDAHSDFSIVKPFLKKDIPIFLAEKIFRRITTLDGKEVPKISLEGSRIVAFAGIANPNSFIRSLKSIGLEVASFVRFPDHHRYTSRDIRKIEFIAEEKKADILLTTEKDFMRLAGISPRLATYILEINFIPKDPNALLDLITKRILFKIEVSDKGDKLSFLTPLP